MFALMIVSCFFQLQEGGHYVLPVILHGDAGQFHRVDSIHVMSSRSLLSKANVAPKAQGLLPQKHHSP